MDKFFSYENGQRAVVVMNVIAAVFVCALLWTGN